jgi:hypothetical protein
MQMRQVFGAVSHRWLRLPKPLIVSHRFAVAAPVRAFRYFSLLRGGCACQSFSLFHITLRWLRLPKPPVVSHRFTEAAPVKAFCCSHHLIEATPVEASYCFTPLRGGSACQSFSLFHIALRRLRLSEPFVISHCFAEATPVEGS